jgi:putative addiction module component (TIGR02574 family)
MSMVKKELLEQILALPPSDRQYIADLLASFEDNLPPQLGPEEQQEMLRRVEEFEKHPETFLSWEQVKEKLAQQRAERSA